LDFEDLKAFQNNAQYIIGNTCSLAKLSSFEETETSLHHSKMGQHGNDHHRPEA
jgi:hypothetical protein